MSKNLQLVLRYTGPFAYSPGVVQAQLLEAGIEMQHEEYTCIRSQNRVATLNRKLERGAGTLLARKTQ
jgi:hypothetical protein